MTCKWQGPAGGGFGSSLRETPEAFPGETYSGKIPAEFQSESGLYPELYPELGGELSGETPGGGTSPAPGFCPPKHSFVDCPNPGNPFEVLDHFAFNSFAMVPKLHGPKIGRIARTIRDSQGTSTAVQRILITGHTDTIGSDDVNFRLSRQRAEKVLHHLCLYLESVSPGLTLKLKFEISPCGKRQTKSKPEISRRVEVFLDPAPVSQKPNPPDHNFCRSSNGRRVPPPLSRASLCFRTPRIRVTGITFNVRLPAGRVTSGRSAPPTPRPATA